MRKILIAALAISGLSVFGTGLRADDKAKGEKITGVLIDNACGSKQKDQESAAKHPKSCSLKEGCAKSGFQVVSGEKHLKLDEKGNELAKKYLEVEENGVEVVVMGTVKDDMLTVTSIEPAGEKSEGEKGVGKEGAK